MTRPLRPVGDPRATLPDLLEALLNKGVILHLDLLISVADIPLIGVNLKAAVAGMETMLEYGLMDRWDKETRAWALRTVARGVPLEPEENLVARWEGGYSATAVAADERRGTVYLTDRRLFVFQNRPPEMMAQVPLTAVECVELLPNPPHAADGSRLLCLDAADGRRLHLRLSDPEKLLDLMGRSTKAAILRNRASSPPLEAHSFEGPVQYFERRSGGGVWRDGSARLDPTEGFLWRATGDVRPALVMRPADIRSVALEQPAGAQPELVLGTSESDVRLRTEEIERWRAELLAVTSVSGEG